jgi:hypothetical protein
MPRKTQFRKSMRKNKSRFIKRKTKKIHKTRKYRRGGGCSNGVCSTETNPSSPNWISKGGSDSETINKDIYSHATDQIFYSPTN